MGLRTVPGPHRVRRMDQARLAFAAAAQARAASTVALTRRLMAVPSPNPPGDVRACAEEAAEILRALAPEAEVGLHVTSPEVTNVVARIAGAGPGRILAFNGHLDTYPVNEALPWTVDPLRGGGAGRAPLRPRRGRHEGRHRRLHPRLRAARRASGALAGGGDPDARGRRGEHGPLGTKWLLDNVPGLARADGVVIGDAGSPRVLRFGEKGFLWIEVEATGRAAHGAHVHLGENAIDRLRAALDAVSRLTDLPVAAPPAVIAAIADAKPVSEPLAGAGEAEVLGRVTVNIGRVEGGTAPNLVPAVARAACDIRLPVGVACDAAEAALHAGLDWLPGISWRVLRRFEPNHTDPDAPIVRLAHQRGGGSAGRHGRGEHARGRFGCPLVPHVRASDRGLRPDAAQHGRRRRMGGDRGTRGRDARPCPRRV